MGDHHLSIRLKPKEKVQIGFEIAGVYYFDLDGSKTLVVYGPYDTATYEQEINMFKWGWDDLPFTPIYKEV